MSVELGVVIGALLAIVAVILVARPLQAAEHDEGNDVPLTDLLARRDTAYQMLRDLDSDFQAGKLGEDDYRPMRVQALAQAAEIVAQIDAYQAEEPVDAEEDDEAPAEAQLDARAGGSFCGSCGAERQPDDEFCRKCGRKLKPVESKRVAA